MENLQRPRRFYVGHVNVVERCGLHPFDNTGEGTDLERRKSPFFMFFFVFSCFVFMFGRLDVAMRLLISEVPYSNPITIFSFFSRRCGKWA